MGSIDHGVCILNLAERGMTEDELFHLLANVPDHAVVLFEDVDAASTARCADGLTWRRSP